MPQPLLEVSGLSKSYGGVHALSDVSLEVLPGEIHALIGENGAGKSTLIKILGGSLRPDSGTVTLDGQPIPAGDVGAAEAAGIAVIHQESTAFLHLSAEDNIFIGREPRQAGGLLLDRARMRRETRALLDRLGENFSTTRPVGELPVAQRQMIGIARALSKQCRLLIMDEPTASLSARETVALFRIARQLRDEGAGLIYVSHRLEEIFDLCDRVTVLRDGRRIETRPVAEMTRPELIRLMVAREVQELTSGERPESTPPAGEIVLEVRDLSRAGAFHDVSFEVRAGEIVGLAGLVGAGRSEVARALFGVDTPSGGQARVAGEALAGGSVQEAVRRGLALVPEDRQHQGLVLPLSVGVNLVLPVVGRLARGGFRSTRAESEVIARLMRELAVRAPGAMAPAHALSGGNQQKLVLGKWLATSPRVLILDEPTRGVDVGAKAEVYRLIRALAAEGMATLMISSDLPEVLGLCDRVLVMRGGEISGELSRAEATQEKILALAMPVEAADTAAVAAA